MSNEVENAEKWIRETAAQASADELTKNIPRIVKEALNEYARTNASTPVLKPNTVDVSGWMWAKTRTEQGWFITGNIPTGLVGFAVNVVPFILGCAYHGLGKLFNKLRTKTPA